MERQILIFDLWYVEDTKLFLMKGWFQNQISNTYLSLKAVNKKTLVDIIFTRLLTWRKLFLNCISFQTLICPYLSLRAVDKTTLVDYIYKPTGSNMWDDNVAVIPLQMTALWFPRIWLSFSSTGTIIICKHQRYVLQKNWVPWYTLPQWILFYLMRNISKDVQCIKSSKKETSPWLAMLCLAIVNDRTQIISCPNIDTF